MNVPGAQYKRHTLHNGASVEADGLILTCTDGSGGAYAVLTCQIVMVGTATITWEGTIDEVTWSSVPGFSLATQQVSTTATASGIYRIPVVGLVSVRARISSYTSGAVYVYGIMASAGESGVSVGGGGVSDHSLLSNLDFASAGHTGFEEEGTADAAITTHVAASDPHTGYLLATGARTGASSQAQTFTNGVLVGNGSISSLSISFATGTGFYSSAANVLKSVAGTVEIQTFGISGAATRQMIVGDGTNVTQFIVDGGAGASRDFIFRSATSPRWIYRVDSTAESGSNAGSNFQVLARDDAGASLGVWLFIRRSDGMVGLSGITSPTAAAHVAASTTTRASLRIAAGTAPTTPNAGDIWDDGALVSYNIDATTNAVVNSLKLRRGSSGTPAAGFGLGIAARLESSTTEDQDAGRLSFEWVTATHASRASRGKLTAFYTTTEQEAVTWDGDTGGLKLGFYGVTPVARQVLATGAGASVDDVITALQNLGLVKQS